MIEDETFNPTQFVYHKEDTTKYHYSAAVAVWFPMAQSGITGTLAGMTVGTWLWTLGYNDPAKWGCTIGVTVITGSWLLLITRWTKITDRIERVTGLDLNRDGRIGGDEPEILTPAPTVRVVVDQDKGRQTQLADLPANVDQLGQLAMGLISGASFSESSWSGGGRPFTRPQFKAVRDVFIARGWAVWVRPDAPAQGVVLTHAGKAVVRHFASVAAANVTPSPSMGRTGEIL